MVLCGAITALPRFSGIASITDLSDNYSTQREISYYDAIGVDHEAGKNHEITPSEEFQQVCLLTQILVEHFSEEPLAELSYSSPSVRERAL